MSQRERRHDPYPWTWEPAACITTTLLGIVLTGLQLGRSLANWLAAGSWRMPPMPDWVVSVPGLLAGDPAAGLNPAPAHPAGPLVFWVSVAVAEALVLHAAVVVFRRVWPYLDPWRPQGFADPAEVDRVLGEQRLHRTKRIIRPDLHDPTRRDR